MTGGSYTVQEAARLLGVSRLHLARLVHTSAVPALDGHLDDAGMARAAELLAEGSASLTERFADPAKVRAGAIAEVVAHL